MSTARDLIKGSLRLIGAVATGETPSADEQNDALYAWNTMLDSWSTENLLVPNVVRETLTLVAGQAAYTIGTNGTPSLNTSRPMEIIKALIQLVGSSPLTELPMQELNVQQFASLRIKPVQSTIPTRFYLEGTFPNETINLWPVPSTANVLVLYSNKPLTQIATVGQTLSLQPGYERAMRYNLAVELAPEYGKAVSPEVAAIAAESKASIKLQNSKPLYLECDAGVLPAGSGFNFYTGDIR